MPVTDNIDELANFILGQVEYVEKDVPAQLTKLATEIQLEMSKGAPVDKGNLRSSIKSIVSDYGLTISMLFYGYFQSFGVNGTKKGEAMGLTPEVASAFGVSEGYEYQFKSKVISEDSGLPYPVRKKIAEFGIKPKDFYPSNIEDKIVEILISNG